jgi:ubiquitin-protein ligase
MNNSYKLTEKNDFYIVKYNDQTFTLHKPSDTINYHKFDTPRDDNSLWIVKLNMYSSIKKPSHTKLLEKFKKLSKKYMMNKDIKNKDIKKCKSNTEDIEVRYNKEKMRLTKISEFNSNGQLVSANAQKPLRENKQVFNENKLKEVIIKEYMDLWKYLEMNHGSLDISNNSLNIWTIRLRKFANMDLIQSLREIKSKFGYDCIEIKITINEIYHPYDPPIVKVIRPRLLDSLMTRISNSKQFGIASWIPSTSMKDIVKRIIRIIETYGKIDICSEYNDIKLYKEGAFVPFENILLDLSSMINTCEIDIIDKDLKIPTKTTKTKKGDMPDYIKTGTGYGTHEHEKWDYKKYSLMLKDRNNRMQKTFDGIIQCVMEHDEEKVYDIVNDSIVMSYMRDVLYGTSLLEIQRSSDTYKKYFVFLQLLCTNSCVELFKQGGKKSLYCILTELKEDASIVLEIDDAPEIVQIIANLTDMMTDLYVTNGLDKVSEEGDSVTTKEEIGTKDDEKTEESKKKSREKKYAKKMKKYKMTLLNDPIHNFSASTTVSSYDSVVEFERDVAISNELPNLKKSLPLYFDSAIYFALNKRDKNKHRYMLTGSVDTPYESGCFIFDFYMPSTYPKAPPLVRYRNNGGISNNFNLYANGNVCLSVLGTYRGPKAYDTEKWIPNKSTIYQVVFSIQSFILTKDPYYNEPSYEKRIGDPKYNKICKGYNRDYRLMTMKYAMRDMLKFPANYPGFEKCIKDHFKYKKKYILKTCKKWVDEAIQEKHGNVSKKGFRQGGTYGSVKEYQEVYEELVLLINKL